MNELLSVEYISRSTGKKERDEKEFLDGFVGEVDKNAFIRAVRDMKSIEEKGGKPREIKVPVRFCLNFPGSLVGFYPNWAFGKEDIEEQGIPLPIKSLRPTKKAAISGYERRLLESDVFDIKSVFEKPVYYYTHSLEMIRLTINFLKRSLSYSWTCSKESKGPDPDKPVVFMEARIYGADNVVPVYSPSRFQGVAIQVLTRDINLGYQERMASDIYLMASTKEYVEYLDGTVVERERGGPDKICKPYLTTPKEFMAKKAAKAQPKDVDEKQKVKGEV